MANVAANVRVGVTGAVYTAPQGTTQPTDGGTALDAAYEDVGYISEDGVVQTMDTDTSEVKAWQNSDVVRKLQTSHDLTYAFTMIETHDVSLEAYYGNYALDGVSGEGEVQITGDQLPRGPWVLSVIDGAYIIRIVIPDGQITERGDVTYEAEDAAGYEVTLTCYPDASDVKAYLYLVTP